MTKNKNIVVLCDGTWNGQSSLTNIFKLSNEIIVTDDQKVEYDVGLGIGDKPIEFLINGALAVDLDEKIKKAYRFIVSNYQRGDDIWLFGFSRGAYTARCVAGIMNTCGILKEDDEIAIPSSFYRLQPIEKTSSTISMNTEHEQNHPSNDAHLGATTGRDGETLSAGSTARNESTARMADNHNALEKDFSRQDGYQNGYGHQHLDANTGSDVALRQIRTAGSISISPELFEKLYLSPQNQVKGELRKTFGNPTPLALIGFLLSLTPLSMTLMGWRGAGGSGSASIGWYYFAGGLLMVLGGLGEWILGNTFPFVVFTSFGAFWLGYAATLQPFYNSFAAYKDPAVETSTGLESVGFNVGVAYFMLCMAILCFVYLICSIRTNLIFFLIFFTLVPVFGLLAGTFLQVANGQAALAGKLQEAAGAFAFVTCMLGWYIFFAIMLASVDFPLDLPLVDLSSVIKGASEKKKIDHVE